MNRIFLDWNQPSIPALIDCLLAAYRVPGSNYYDLSDYVLVFPNRASSKRFLTLLADCAWQNHCTIEPPRVKHMGDFMELLYEQKAPCASLLTQQVLWAEALREVHAEAPNLFASMFPAAPDEKDTEAWHILGVQLTEIFQEIARENLSFKEVYALCQALAAEAEQTKKTFFPFQEVRRWEFLAAVESLYFQRLDAAGLWDRQAARLFALRNNPIPTAGNAPASPSASGLNLLTSHDFQINFRLGIVGCVDLSALQREFLKRVSAQTDVFIFAPESMQDRFEEDGTLKTGHWSQIDPELNERLKQNLFQETKPEEQVQRVIEWLRKIAPQTSIDEITLGLVDESLEPILLQQLALNGVPTIRSGKKMLPDLQPWRLVKRMYEYFQSIASYQPGKPLAELMEAVGPEYETLALFLRQEDVGNYLRSLHDETGEPLIPGDWIVELDKYFNQYYPARMPHPASKGAENLRNGFPNLFCAYQTIHSILFEYAVEYVNFHSLLSIVMQFLKRICCWKVNYDSEDEEEYQIIRGCMELNHVFSDKLQIPQQFLPFLDLNLPQALSLLLNQTTSKQMVTSSIPGTISIQRWLDLALDDSSALALLGMNENFIPESISEHIFLPNQLREKLHVKTNQNRLERDIYNLSLILASRRDICVTLGRISSDGQSLFPSRLLLTDTSDALIPQVIELFDEPKEPELTGIQKSGQKKASRLFQTPAIPESFPPICDMSVTDFAVYIQNPYIFYLQRVLRLNEVNDSARELDAANFGTLFHDVLQAFGQKEIARQKESNLNSLTESARLNDPEAFKAEKNRIQNDLLGVLKQYSFARFGAQALPIVQIQCCQLEERLKFLAEKQAEQYRDGWRIWAVEHPLTAYLRENSGAGEILKFGPTKPLETSPKPMLIHGKLDRIDVRRLEDGSTEWRIWDYKTFKETPTEKHFGRKQLKDSVEPDDWKDFQLPLYLHLLRSARQSGLPEYKDLNQIDPKHVRVGYILVPKKVESTQFCAADWSESIFRTAEEKIREIAAKVHAKEFPNTGDLSIWDRDTVLEWIANGPEK